MTAVKWLEEQLFELRNPTLNQIEIMKQAKEMEKQQIIDAMDVCQRTDFYVKYECSEDYYNKTFKTKQQ